MARNRSLWDVQVYFGAPDRLTFLRLQALVRAAFASDAKANQSLRLHTAYAGGQPSDAAKTALTSNELASYLTLPREEFRGYQVITHSRYGVTPPVEKASVRISVPRALADPAHLEPCLSGSDLLRDGEVRQRMESLAHTYQKLSLPFQGCDVCRSQCVYRGLGEAVSHLHEARSAINAYLSEAKLPPEVLLSNLFDQVDLHGRLPGITSLSRGSVPSPTRFCRRLSRYMDRRRVASRLRP